jgi:Fe-S cluster biogenesis protein NfuA
MELPLIDNLLLSQVEESLDSLRPYLRDDGGDVEIVEITKEGVVRVKLLGNCKSCPQSFMTMKAGIEEAIKSTNPQIKSVEAV